MAFKILVTSQKGGVGKSTVAANLSAFLSCQLGMRTTLIDWDPHGSSSNWLRRAPNVGVLVQHLTLPVEMGGTVLCLKRACICAAPCKATTLWWPI